MKHLVLLAILLAADAHARLQTEWELLRADQELHWGTTLESDDYRLYLGHWDGLYISLDHGYTWDLTLPDRSITCIAFGPNTVYAGTYNYGLYRSETRGNTWKPKNKGFAFEDNPDWPGDYSPIEQILVTRFGMVITLKYHSGTYTSTDRGESWHEITDEWGRFFDPWSMTEFDSYLWTGSSSGSIVRSDDNGETWKHAGEFKGGRMWDWEVSNHRLCAVTQDFFGRWNEAEEVWEYFSEGLEFGFRGPRFQALGVNRGRLFAGLDSGVYMFDEQSETFIPAGLHESRIVDLVSHHGYLYVAVEKEGVYRASIPIVQPYGKAAVTWGAIKLGNTK